MPATRAGARPSEVTPMSALTATAYTRFVQSLRDLEGVKLHAHEAETLRAAADARLFGDEDAALLLGDAFTVLALLESAGRLQPLTAHGLRNDLDESFAVAVAAEPDLAGPSPSAARQHQ